MASSGAGAQGDELTAYSLQRGWPIAIESVRKAKFGEPRVEAEPRRSDDVGHVMRGGRATATGAVQRDPRAASLIDGKRNGVDGMLPIAIKGANAGESILPKRIDPELA